MNKIFSVLNPFLKLASALKLNPVSSSVKETICSFELDSYFSQKNFFVFAVC